MDGLDIKPLNLKKIIIKDFQIKNQRFRRKINDLKSKVESLESKTYLREHYGRRDNLEITGVPHTVENNKLKENVIQISNEIDPNVASNDFEPCHRVGKTKNQ